MSEIKHTPTPWTKDRHEQLRGADGRAVNVWGLGIGWSSRDDETEGNSELIIEAVNSHASLTAERDRLREENERLREASWRLMVAANDVDLGRSIHNSRKPDQAIEGPVWVILRNASAAVRATLEGDAS